MLARLPCACIHAELQRHALQPADDRVVEALSSAARYMSSASVDIDIFSLAYPYCPTPVPSHDPHHHTNQGRPCDLTRGFIWKAANTGTIVSQTMRSLFDWLSSITSGTVCFAYARAYFCNTSMKNNVKQTDNSDDNNKDLGRDGVTITTRPDPGPPMPNLEETITP